jgi:putative transposase
MDDGFQLLLTPSDDEGLPAAMQSLGRAYARYYNNVHARTGALWDGRYRSTLLQAERYLLPCQVMMDLKPVKAGCALEPVEYVWSSHRCLVGRASDRLIRAHALYWGLGNTPFAREAAYAELVRRGLSPTTQADLELAARQSWVRGDDAFIEELRQHTVRRLQPGKAGRPVRALS